MNYSDHIKIVSIAVENKPKFGDDCNHCGWCCLTEVCAVGAELSGSKALPCKYMVSENNKHKCSLVIGEPLMAEIIGSGEGCCAKTQQEVLDEMNATNTET
jgi:hypothetical protein